MTRKKKNFFIFKSSNGSRQGFVLYFWIMQLPLPQVDEENQPLDQSKDGLGQSWSLLSQQLLWESWDAEGMCVFSYKGL